MAGEGDFRLGDEAIAIDFERADGFEGDVAVYRALTEAVAEAGSYERAPHGWTAGVLRHIEGTDAEVANPTGHPDDSAHRALAARLADEWKHHPAPFDIAAAVNARLDADTDDAGPALDADFARSSDFDGDAEAYARLTDTVRDAHRLDRAPDDWSAAVWTAVGESAPRGEDERQDPMVGSNVVSFPRRWPWRAIASFAAAAAVVAFVYSRIGGSGRDDSALPAYGIELSTTLGAPADPRETPIRLMGPDSTFRIYARPATSVDGEVSLRAHFEAADSPGRRVDWTPQVEIHRGVARIIGTASELPIGRGTWTLVIRVGRPDGDGDFAGQAQRLEARVIIE